MKDNFTTELLTITLPMTATVGDEIMVVGIGADGWRVLQNPSIQIVDEFPEKNKQEKNENNFTEL